MNTRQKVLEDALKCVNGEREKQYGNPEDNFKRIAKRWSLYLTELYEDEGVVIELDPIDVARMMIEFKLARANGPKDKLDNYIDMIGYSACAAEIFENGNEDKTDEYAKNPYSYYHDKLLHYVSIKHKDIPLEIDKLKEYNRKLPRELSDLLHQAAEDCVSEGKYGGLKLLDYYKEIDKLFEKYKPEIAESKTAGSRSCSKKASDNIRGFLKNLVEMADECKECDYAEKCIGTGVCLKDTEKKCLKDKPDYKCNRNDCGQFDACMAAYQHYICNKTKETSEAIDKYIYSAVYPRMNGKAIKQDTYSYYHDKLSHYVSVKAKEEHVSLENLKDINREFPRELFKYLDLAATDCVINGKKVRDCYEEIDELFEKYRSDILAQKFMKTCNSFWEAYANVSDYITSSSRKANVNPVDVVHCLVENEHTPSEMAALLMDNKLGFDDVASYVDDAINEVKKEV